MKLTIAEKEAKTAIQRVDEKPAYSCDVVRIASDELVEAIKKFFDATANVLNSIVNFVIDALRQIIAEIAHIYNEVLREIATSKEWHLMHHARRRRTRKKYENRIVRRMKAFLGGGRL